MNKNYQKECESSTEYALPDYMGDVKKILSVSASALPSGKFMSDSTVEFSGIVSYDIMYSDFEGRLTHFNTSSDFNLSVGVSSESYIDAMIDTKVSNLAVRLVGPRKLILKSVLSNNVRVSEEENLACLGDAFEADRKPEVLSENLKIEHSIFANSPEREYAEEAEKLPGVTADDIEIIASSGAVRITESEATDGGVNVRGELIITSIVRTEEQPPFAIKKIIPFDENISFEGLREDMQTVTSGYLTSVSTAVNEDEDGSIIVVNAIAEFTSVASCNNEHTVIKDAYLKDRDTVTKTEDYVYSSLVCMGSSEERVQVAIAREDLGLELSRNILSMNADIRSCEKKLNSNSFEISGDIIFSGIACEVNEENDVTYSPAKFSSLFKLDVKLGCQIPENAALDVLVSVPDTETTLDAEKLTAKCLLQISYRIFVPCSVKRVSECSLYGEEEYISSPSTVTVYYPTPEEALFDIAKKFHTTPAKLAEDNNLTAEAATLGGAAIKKLIIR